MTYMTGLTWARESLEKKGFKLLHRGIERGRDVKRPHSGWRYLHDLWERDRERCLLVVTNRLEEVNFSIEAWGSAQSPGVDVWAWFVVPKSWTAVKLESRSIDDRIRAGKFREAYWGRYITLDVTAMLRVQT